MGAQGGQGFINDPQLRAWRRSWCPSPYPPKPEVGLDHGREFIEPHSPRSHPLFLVDLLDVDETAKLTRRSPSWLHHHGHTLPGFRQSRGKGGRKFWSRRALLAWISDGDGTC